MPPRKARAVKPKGKCKVVVEGRETDEDDPLAYLLELRKHTTGMDGPPTQSSKIPGHKPTPVLTPKTRAATRDSASNKRKKAMALERSHSGTASSEDGDGVEEDDGANNEMDYTGVYPEDEINADDVDEDDLAGAEDDDVDEEQLDDSRKRKRVGTRGPGGQWLLKELEALGGARLGCDQHLSSSEGKQGAQPWRSCLYFCSMIIKDSGGVRSPPCCPLEAHGHLVKRVEDRGGSLGRPGSRKAGLVEVRGSPSAWLPHAKASRNSGWGRQEPPQHLRHRHLYLSRS